MALIVNWKLLILTQVLVVAAATNNSEHLRSLQKQGELWMQEGEESEGAEHRNELAVESDTAIFEHISNTEGTEHGQSYKRSKIIPQSVVNGDSENKNHPRSSHGNVVENGKVKSSSNRNSEPSSRLRAESNDDDSWKARDRRSAAEWPGGSHTVGEGEERWERAAISRQTTENQLHRPRNRNRDAKRRKVRVTEVEELVKQAISSTVSAALRQELEPLHTALRIVRLDTFSEGIIRQLSTLEHIQSKLLTEYGEMREAVTQASRTSQDLAQQVASLDAKVGSLVREVQAVSSSGAGSGAGGSSGGAGMNFGSSSSSGPTRTEELKAVLMQASAAFAARLTATERRVKDDLGTLENRMTEAMKRSQLAFDSRLSSITADTNRILNRTCWESNTPPSSQSFITTNKLFSLDDAPMQSPGYPFSPGVPVSFASSSHRGFQSSSGSGVRAREPVGTADHQQQPQPQTSQPRGADAATLLPFPSWGRSDTLNLAAVTRLATEIATQISREATEQPRDCSDVASQGQTVSGVYTIHPASCSARLALKVWCDLDTDGGGWTLLQRRGSKDSGRDDFFRDWAEYKWGFGDLEADHWIGNEYIYQLTSTGDYELRVDLQDWGDEQRWAVYRHFHLGDEQRNYTLHIGDYRGNAGNSLKYHQGAPFSTKDRDNDVNPMSHCARTFHGAWWFTACHESHLNGRYHRSPHRTYGDGINWMTFRGLNYSHKSSRMMVRPATAASSLLSSAGVSSAASAANNAPGASAPRDEG